MCNIKYGDDMKVVILQGSPNINGSTNLLCDRCPATAFIK